MAVWWTGSRQCDCGDLADRARDYALIRQAADIAADSARRRDLMGMACAVTMSYRAQLAEGMAALEPPDEAEAVKYCGGGHGGYALGLFAEPVARDRFVIETPGSLAVEPHANY